MIYSVGIGERAGRGRLGAAALRKWTDVNTRPTRGTHRVVVTTERLPRCQVSLSIEVAPERVEASMETAARRISEKVKIRGFRPGRAPRPVVEQTVGRGAVLQEALDQLVPDVYREALESESIEPVDQPDIELTSTEPLVVKATVPVRPSIELRDYATLRVPRPEPRSAEPVVEETLEGLRRRYATLEPVDRAIAWNDTVRADITIVFPGREDPDTEEDAEFSVREEHAGPLPGFLERLIGLKRGGPHEFTVDIPDDYPLEDRAGEAASCRVTIHDVKEEILPDLDEDFARSLDEGYDSVDALRANLLERTAERLAEESLREYRMELLDLLVSHAELDYPDVLVERHVDRMIDERSNHASHTREGLQEWLVAIGQTEEEVREALRDAADHAVRRSLVLSEFVRAEGLAVESSAIDAEVERTVGLVEEDASGLSPENAQRWRQLVESEESRANIAEQLLTTLAMGRLVEIAEEPPVEGDGGAAPRRRTARRRRARTTAAATEDAGGSDADEADAAEASVGEGAEQAGDSPG